MSKKRLLSPQEEHEEKVEQTVNMITAEDLVEQVVYSANTPECCKGGQQAENMLSMLGANVIDSDIYHTPEEHQKLEM